MSNNILTGKTEEEIMRFTQEAQMIEIRGMEVTYNNLHNTCMQKCMNTRFDSAKLYSNGKNSKFNCPKIQLVNNQI